MSSSEDVVLDAYPYQWRPWQSELPLKDFLTKYKPSMVQNDGTKPWIWLKTEQQPTVAEALKIYEGEQKAVEEASKILKEATDRVEQIKNDSSIPLRSNKKTGAKGKKEVREQIQAEATEDLKKMAIKHGYVCGKWMIFAPAEKVDMIWSKLATSLVSGPLSATVVDTAKVATSPPENNPNYQHLICLYMPNIYDKDEVTEVLKVLLRRHGLNPSGVKSDLYTLIGLDSKHPSGIPPSTWKSSTLLNNEEIKGLRETFFSELSSQGGDTNAEETKGVVTGPEVSLSKPKPKLKKKSNDDPFASDDDEANNGEGKRREEIQKKTATQARGQKFDDSNSLSDDDQEVHSTKRKKTISGEGRRKRRRAEQSD